jgi:hypothetical protein
MWGFLSIIVALVGAVVYLVATNPKYAELGRLSFVSGLLAFLLQNGTHIVALASGR